MRRIKWKEKDIDRIILVIIGVIILSISLIQTKGVSICADTIEYIEMRSFVPALYPVFLWVFRLIFGESYLIYVVIFQTLLAILSSLLLEEIICEQFHLNRRYEKYMVFLALISVFFTGGTGIADGCGSVNFWILTEGISYAIFYLFVAVNILFTFRKKHLYWLCSLILCALLILCRDQFWACCGILLLESIYIFLSQKTRRIFAFEICSIIVMSICSFGLQRTYTNHFRTGDDDAFRRQSVITHYAVFMEEEDLVACEDSVEGDLLTEIYQELSKQGILISQNEDRWLFKVSSYRKNFGETYRIISSIISDYLEKNDTSERPYELIAQMEKCLQNHMKDWIYMSIVSLLPIVITMSVCVYVPIPHVEMLLIVYSCLITLIYLCLLCFLLLKQKRFSKEFLFGSFVLIYMLVNGIGTTLAIRPIARYVFYSFGLFYIALYLMFRETIRMEIKNAKQQDDSSRSTCV